MKLSAYVSMAALVVTMGASAQKNQIQNALNGIKYGELDKAKAAIDAASEHPDTKGTAKLFLVKTKTYNAIFESKNEAMKKLDADAAEKAFQSALSCLKTDNEKLYTEEVTPLLIYNANRIYNQAGAAMNTEDYEKSKRLYNMLPEAFAYDKDKSLERANITKESITFNLYIVSRKSNDLVGMKENLQKLIDIKYKNPSIYYDMADIFFRVEKDTVKGLSYIDQGLNLFEDNLSLIMKQVVVYDKQKKTNVLIDKLNKSIESSPDNEVLHTTLGIVYDGSKQFDKAEVSYKKAVEIKPDHVDANLGLGVIYYNRGAESSKKANELPPSQLSKAAEFDKKTEESFKLAMPYLEKVYENAKGEDQQNAKQMLEKIYRNLGETEKLNKLKAAGK